MKHSLEDLYIKMDNLEEALKTFREILDLKPDYSEVRFKTGYIYEARKKHADAAAEYEKVLQANPKSSGIHSMLGNVYRELKDYSKAVEYYEKAVKINPSETGVAYNLGILYYNQGKFEQALKELLRSKNSEQNSDVCLLVGEIYSKLGKKKEAVEEYKKWRKWERLTRRSIKRLDISIWKKASRMTPLPNTKKRLIKKATM